MSRLARMQAVTKRRNPKPSANRTRLLVSDMFARTRIFRHSRRGGLRDGWNRRRHRGQLSASKMGTCTGHSPSLRWCSRSMDITSVDIEVKSCSGMVRC